MSHMGYVVVASGPHIIQLIKHNPIEVKAIFDLRGNGSLIKAGALSLTDNIYVIGKEKPMPFISIVDNRQYYQKIKKLLDKYKGCRFVITDHYTPLLRFIIDNAGAENIELWEDGLNHYLKLEQINVLYKPKAFAKLLAGFYAKGIFDSKYRENELIIKDRFGFKNLVYPRPKVKYSEFIYYVGQPLIEDNLISEKVLQKVLSDRFAGRDAIYLPHPREQKRNWLSDIFEVLDIDVNAERYIIESGASEIHSAFSTVNLNLYCRTNIFHCKGLGMKNIVKQLAKYDFGVDII